SDGQAFSDPASVSLTVQAAATFRINDLTVVEGNSGTTLANRTEARRVGEETGVRGDYATADGTAHAGGDYQLTTGTPQCAASEGETHQISVLVLGEKIVELDGSVLGILSSAQAGGRNVTVAAGQGVGTIANDEVAPLSINDVAVTEGNSGTTLAN